MEMEPNLRLEQQAVERVRVRSVRMHYTSVHGRARRHAGSTLKAQAWRRTRASQLSQVRSERVSVEPGAELAGLRVFGRRVGGSSQGQQSRWGSCRRIVVEKVDGAADGTVVHGRSALHDGGFGW